MHEGIHSLTSWSRALLEKSVVTQLLKKMRLEVLVAVTKKTAVFVM
jgi:hypothetical protein